MKKRNYLLLLICTLCVGVITTTAQATSIRLELSSTDIFVGDMFDLKVYADGVPSEDGMFPDGVLAFGFDLNYADSEFEYKFATVNTPLFDDLSNSDSTPEVAGMTFLPPSGDGILLATLNFTALLASEDVLTLGIEADLSLINNEGLILLSPFGSQSITENLDLSVTAAPVPEPTTIVLLATGLLGLAGFRRKKNK